MKISNLEEVLVKSLELSGYSEIQINKNKDNMYEITLRKISNYKIYLFLRNVSNAGWSDKPEKRRVQVTAFDVKKLPPTGKHVTAMILGVQEIFDRFIFVAWDIYKYGGHATNRSCYINTTNIYNAFLRGFITTMDQSQKVWLADSYNLDKLINNYIEYNYSSIGD